MSDSESPQSSDSAGFICTGERFPIRFLFCFSLNHSSTTLSEYNGYTFIARVGNGIMMRIAGTTRKNIWASFHTSP